MRSVSQTRGSALWPAAQADCTSQLPLGRLTLPSGREVHNTGSVLIGIRHGERPESPRAVTWGALGQQLSADALAIQHALLAPRRRAAAWVRSLAAGLAATVIRRSTR